MASRELVTVSSKSVSAPTSALQFRSLKLRTTQSDDAELVFGAAGNGSVRGVARFGRGQERVNELTGAHGAWPGVPIKGVRALAVETTSGKLHAVTCAKDGGEDALWVYDTWRQQFCKIGENYGCLGHGVAFGPDNSLYAVSVDRRQLLRLYSAFPTVIANFSSDVVPLAAALDSKCRLFVGAQRVNKNQQQAEVYHVDEASGELTLVAAVGGALLDTLIVTPDDRVFFTDAAHDAVHEVEFRTHLPLEEELKLIRGGFLASGARHAGGAGAANKYGHAAFRTNLVAGAEDLATGGGAAAWTTPDGTDLLLLADTFQLKSLTADRFIDSWPLGAATAVPPTRFIGARNVYVAPERTAPKHEPRAVVTSDWAAGVVHVLSPFAPHEGDFEVEARISSGLVAPYGVALTLDGTVLVADFATGQVTAHTAGAATHSVVASGLDGPVGLALAPADSNGDAIFVTEYTAGRVTRIERATGAKTVVVAGLSAPEGIAVSPLNGKLTVVESAGERRLLEIDAASGAVVVLASQLPSAGDSTASHPGTLAAVAWTQARAVPDDADVAFGKRSAAALYVVLDGDVRRHEVVLRANDDPHSKPTDVDLFHAQTPIVDDKNRSIVVLSLFDKSLPAPFAVPSGTWLRVRAFRQDDVDDGVYAPSNTRLIAADIPGFVTTRLYPATIRANTPPGIVGQPTGQSELEVELRAPGTYTVRDLQTGANTTVVVYDAAYDDLASYKYCKTPEAEPVRIGEPLPVCRTELECALGYRATGNRTASGCYFGLLQCLPVAQSQAALFWDEKNGGAVHGGNGPYVPKSWQPGQPVQRPTFPGSIYEWATWRNWWEVTQGRAGSPAEKTFHWYKPALRRFAEGHEVEQC